MKELPDDHLPRLQAQLSAHQANPEWPHFGRDALDHGHAVFTIADHLRKFWDPGMRGEIIAHAGRGGEGLKPSVLAALKLLEPTAP